MLLLLLLLAQDVYRPPVPIGIAGDAKIRDVKPIPFPAESRQWVRMRSPRFDVISSAPEERTRAIITEIETLASALGGKPSTRSTVFLFEHRRESQPYFDLLFARDDSKATGAYVRHEGGGTMFVDASRRKGIERTAMHELIHDLLREREMTPPLWLEEGLAEYFSTAVVRGNRVEAGAKLAEATTLLARRTPMPLSELFAMNAESDVAAAPLFYAQSWAAVDWLMGLDSEAFFRFTGALERGMTVEAALQTHYGKSLRELEGAIRRRRRDAQLVIFEAAPVTLEKAVPLDRATLLFELGRFLSYVAGAEKEVQRHYAEALRLDPKHARTLAALARFEEAVAADPNDAEVHLLYAESLMPKATGPFAGIFEREAGDVEQFRKARAAAERALALGTPEPGRAHGLIGTSHLVERDLAAGIAALERARSLAPQRMDFALNLFSMYLRTGDRAKADALYAAVFEHARDKQTLFAARNVLVAAETHRANQLAFEGKLDEAAAVVRELAARTPDAAGRRELESEAARLASLADVNRHITRYNEAIALVNAGKNKQALALLDELLQVATDEQVVKDAKKLRDEVRKRR